MLTFSHTVAVFFAFLAIASFRANAVADINNPLGATCAALNTKANICLDQATNPGNMPDSHALACVACANVFLEDMDDKDLSETTCSETQEDGCHVAKDCRCGACADEVADYLNCEMQAMWKEENGQDCPLECSGTVLSYGLSWTLMATAVAASIVLIVSM